MPPATTNHDLSFRPKLPYKDHPIYKLRNATLWSLFIGLILVFVTGFYKTSDLTILLFLYATSFLFIIHDLMTWAIEKAALVALNLPRFVCAADGRLYQRIESNGVPSIRDDDEDGPDEPIWPRLYVIILDAIYALVYQWIFWSLIMAIEFSYRYSYESPVLKSYAALSSFVVSILHGKAFLEERKARCKRNLVKELEQKPCRQCGQANPVSFQKKEDEDGASRFGFQKEEFGIPGWAKAFNERRNRAFRRQRDDLEAGRSNDEDETESLVIAPTPESSKGYGTLSQSVHSLSGDGEEVIKKKGLKRVIGEEWIVEGDSGNGKGNGKGKAKVDDMDA